MLMNKKLIVLFGLLLCIGFVFSETLQPSDLTWTGSMSVTLDKDTFGAGENITGHIRIANKEEYPIIGGIVSLQIAQGEYDYPSQFTTSDNVVFEKTIKDIWVLPNTVKDIDFDLGTALGGDYRLDAYFSVLRSKHTGASWIFMSPLSKNFLVEGNTYERLQIFRPLTSFNNVVGPVGFPVEPGGEISGKIFISNETGETRNNLKLGITLCDWSTGFCDNKIEEVFDIGDITPTQNDPIIITINAPTIPSAYEINMRLYSGEITESIYKSRVIVSGGTAKLRKILIDGFKEKDYSLTTTISGSPDHFNYPTFEKFVLGMTIYSSDKVIQEENENIQSISTSEIIQKSFDITSKSFDRVCLTITKASKQYDEFCFDVELDEIQQAYDIMYPEIVKVNWEYNEEASELAIDLTKSIPINSRVRIINKNQTIYEKEFKGENIYNKILFIPKENMTMLVDDFDAKDQQVISLNLALSEAEKEAIENGTISTGDVTIICNGQVCASGLVCSGQTIISSEGPCCQAECIPAIESEGFFVFRTPLIFWIAIILIIIAIAVTGTTIQKVRNK